MKFLLRLAEVNENCSLSESLKWVEERKYPIFTAYEDLYDSYNFNQLRNRNSFDETTLFDNNIEEVFKDYQKYKLDIEIAKSRLFLAIKEEEIKYTGVRVSELKKLNLDIPNFDDLSDEALYFYYDYAHNAKWEEIDNKYFICNNILWEKNLLQIDDGDAFAYISCDFWDLMEVFPELDYKEFTVEKHNDSLIFDIWKFENQPPKYKKSGRKPKVNWDIVHPYIAKKIIELEDPFSNQDALAHEVQEWILKKFSIKLGISTITEKLKHYWDFFKSEN